MTARPCFATREWAPWTRGGIGEAVGGLVEAAPNGAIILWDQSSRTTEKARGEAGEGVSIFGLSELARDSIPLHAFRSEAHWRSHRFWEALKGLLELESIESVEFPDFDGLGFVSIKAARLGLWTGAPPLKVRIHGTLEWTARGNGVPLGSLEERQRVAMERYALHHAAEVIAPSQEVLDAYRAQYQMGSRVAIAPPPVRARATDEQALGLRPARSLPLRIGFLGKLQPIKGPAVLIRAVVERLEADPEALVEVHLVGGDEPGRYSDSHLSELRKLIPKKYEAVFIFHGALSREEAHRRMLSCHAVALPSRSETFGLAARETAALEIPLALTSIPGFRGGMKAARGSIEYFDLDSVAQLGQIIEGWLVRLVDRSWPPPRRSASEIRCPATPDPRTNLLPSRHDDAVSPASLDHVVRASPRLSIVVPFFEMQAYVFECLDSIDRDDTRDVEVLVVDDGSTSIEAHESIEQVRRRFGNDPNRRVFVKRNGGLGSARNFGVEKARGDFVLPLDPDDLIVPGYLGAAIRALDRVDELAYVVGISSLFRDGEDPACGSNFFVPYDPDRGMLFFENGAGTAAAVFRTECLRRFPYREDLPAYEDWDLYLRLASGGLRGEMLPIVTHRYRQRPDGLSRLAHRYHDRLVSSLIEPHLASVDPDLRSAFGVYLASVTRMRGLGAERKEIGRFLFWVESFYRRRLKARLTESVGEERRDRLARWVRELLGRL